VRGFTVHSATMPRHGAPVISRLNDIIARTSPLGLLEMLPLDAPQGQYL